MVRKICDLRSDMCCYADDLDAWELGTAGINVARIRPWNAEFVLVSPGRNFLMGGGVDIRIDPHGNLGRRLLGRREL